MENKTVRLVGSKSAKNGKSAKPRYIPMNGAMEELFSVLKRGAPDERVIPFERNLRKKFSQALRWAEVPFFRVHDMRHTFASHLAMRGVPLYTIAHLLGHSSIETTKRYAHLAPENLATAVQSLSFGIAQTPNDKSATL
jgi:integrase